jgi:AcrR family transcriptional regulator
MLDKSLLRKTRVKVHHRTTMGQEQRAQTRANILSAAIGVFAEEGPYKPVIEDVVRAARVSRGTFYNYFSTMDEVREAAVEFAVSEFIARIGPAVEAIDNPIIRFATAARLYQRKAIADPFFAAFVTSVTNTPGIIDKNSHRDLREAIDQHLIGLRDMDAAFLIAIAVVHYGAQYFLRHPSGPLRPKDFVRSILVAWRVEPELIEKALALPLPIQIQKRTPRDK